MLINLLKNLLALIFHLLHSFGNIRSKSHAPHVIIIELFSCISLNFRKIFYSSNTAGKFDALFILSCVIPVKSVQNFVNNLLNLGLQKFCI